MTETYETISGTVLGELEISRSRFLTRLERVDSEELARQVIHDVRAEHPRARHHCSAFVIGPTARIQRSNDDGEPSGTAGAPMLDALLSAGLSDVVAVVTRYFGGVLLGAGGLTRAYRAAVADTVATASRITRTNLTRVRITTGYDLAPPLEAELRRRSFLIEGSDYAEAVTLRVLVSAGRIDEVRALAAELTSGSAEVAVHDEVWADL